MSEWIGALASLASLAVLVALYIFAIGRHFGTLEARMEQLDNKLEGLKQQTVEGFNQSRRDLSIMGEWIGAQNRELIGLLASILGYLTMNMSTEERQNLLRQYGSWAPTAQQDAFIRRLRSSNPLLPAEVDRLEFFIQKARRGDWFTPEEVEEYNGLVRKVENDRPRDPAVWPLIALGAFLFGLYVASRRREGG